MIKNDASYIKAINYIEKSQEIFKWCDNDTITVNVELIKDRDADWEVIEIGY